MARFFKMMFFFSFGILGYIIYYSDSSSAKVLRKYWFSIVSCTIVVVLTVILSEPSWKLISGQLELTRWHDSIISNKNVLFFFNLMSICALTGIAGHSARKTDKKKAILVYFLGATLVIMVWLAYVIYDL